MITLSEKDVVGLHPHNDDPMVITIEIEEWEIKRVIVDQQSSADIILGSI